MDVHLHQIVDAPQMYVNVDRRLASEMGVSEQSIAQNLNVSLSGSFQVSPNFWADPKSGTPYQLWVQTPEWRNDDIARLMNTPVSVHGTRDGEPGIPILLSNIATMQRQPEQTVINHVNTQPTFDILANVQDADLGSVRNAVEQIVGEEQARLPAPTRFTCAARSRAWRAPSPASRSASGSRSWRSTCCSSSTIRPGSIPSWSSPRCRSPSAAS